MINKQKYKVAIIGLGYVGLPIAIALSNFFKVVGYDINKQRINDLSRGKDETREIKNKLFHKKRNLKFSYNFSNLKQCNFYIVAVPTPINKKKKPDLKYLINATKLVSKILKKNDTVVYESTVFPGCTEEICIPILEKKSGLKINKDFICGYSPERINPGDSKHSVQNIDKIVSSSSKEGLSKINYVYKRLTNKKLIKVDSIKIAEGAKIIENAQRDINIAFMNELSILFRRMNIDFSKVLKAAKTKWNFINFSPGTVGGHCIGVDPYYLADKARKLNFNPKVILSGRNINDSMHLYISREFKKKMLKKKKGIKNRKILIVGLTFKENVPDYRNSQAIRIINNLSKIGFNVYCFDPLIKINNKKNILSFKKLNLYQNYFDGILILVGHQEIKKKGLSFFKKLMKKKNVFFDIKNIFKSNADFKL